MKSEASDHRAALVLGPPQRAPLGSCVRPSRRRPGLHSELRPGPFGELRRPHSELRPGPFGERRLGRRSELRPVRL
jgi:hypothetical protein